MKLKDTINLVKDNWADVANDRFFQINRYGKMKGVLIKFRTVLTGPIFLFNEIKVIDGLSFVDILGLNDYLLGELVLVNSKMFQPLVASKAIVLKEKNGKNRRKVKVIREDGFLNTYYARSGIVITTI